MTFLKGNLEVLEVLQKVGVGLTNGMTENFPILNKKEEEISKVNKKILFKESKEFEKFDLSFPVVTMSIGETIGLRELKRNLILVDSKMDMN